MSSKAGQLEELPGEAPDDQQGVLDFVGDVGHGVAHRGQALGLQQPVFHLLVLGDVPDDAGEIEVAPNFRHGKGDAHGEFAAVPAQGGEAHVLADHPGLPGGHIAPHVVPVLGFIGGRNDEVQILAQGLFPGEAEHLLGALVVADDEVVFVDGDDGVGGAVDDAGVDLLLLAQLLELADQVFQKAGGGAGDQVVQLFRGKIGQPGRHELAIQDEIELFRVQIRQGFDPRAPRPRVGWRTRRCPPAGNLPGKKARSPGAS